VRSHKTFKFLTVHFFVGVNTIKDCKDFVGIVRSRTKATELKTL
jgi:hypothetical protein